MDVLRTGPFLRRKKNHKAYFTCSVDGIVVAVVAAAVAVVGTNFLVRLSLAIAVTRRKAPYALGTRYRLAISVYCSSFRRPQFSPGSC